jgi:SAM-dependent methyltransferase
MTTLPNPPSTAGPDYTRRLSSPENTWWKRVFDVQAPYRWNLRRLKLGNVLDVGCGIGRNLMHLDPGSVGIDHNPYSIEVARQRGLSAFVSDEFARSPLARSGAFDSLLLAHVLEHMEFGAARQLLRTHVPYLRPGGRMVVICPQEAGFRCDPTHVEFFDFARLQECLSGVGFKVVRAYSFPFPRFLGRVFKYNEFVVVGERV